jgi:hypothetical protein
MQHDHKNNRRYTKTERHNHPFLRDVGLFLRAQHALRTLSSLYILSVSVRLMPSSSDWRKSTASDRASSVPIRSEAHAARP